MSRSNLDQVQCNVLAEDANLFINRRNGAWFIATDSQTTQLWDYFSTRGKRGHSRNASIESMLKSVRFFSALHASAEIKEVTSRFTSFIISVTRDCNLHCSYCWANANEVTSDISFETIERFVDAILHREYCSDVVRFQFSGGEPTIKIPLIDKAIKYINSVAEQRNIKVMYQIQTNAFSLQKSVIDWIINTHVGVGVSIDQIDPLIETGRVTRNGVRATAQVLKNIRRLVDAGIRPVVLTAVSKDNCREVSKIPHFLRELGLENMRIIPLIVGRGGVDSFSSISAEVDEIFCGVRNLVDELLKINTDDVSTWVYDLHISQYVRKIMYDRDIYYPCAQSPCGAGRQVLSLFGNGDVFPCDGFHRYDLFKCGNIWRDPIEAILRAPSIEALAARDSKAIPGCRDCAFNNYCIGGCAQEVEMIEGNLSELSKSSIYCGYYKRLFTYLFDMVNSGKDLTRLLRRLE